MRIDSRMAKIFTNKRVIALGSDAVNKLKKGADTIADLVKSTLGPSGRNVVIGVRGGTPTITNDGVTIAKDVFLVDEIEDLGARVMREVSIQTNDKVGDGTTTAMVLAQAILKKGLENVGNKADVISDHIQNPIRLKQTIDAECAAVAEKLTKSAKQIKTKEDLRNVARVSAENETLALAVADTFF